MVVNGNEWLMDMNEIFNSLMVFTDDFMVLNDGQTQE